MQEMVEPDRTIMIVSIIGLVVIWGSVAYHKLAQGPRLPEGDGGPIDGAAPAAAGGSVRAEAAAGGGGGGEAPGPAGGGRSKRRGKGRR